MEATPVTYIQQPHADGAGAIWLSFDLRGPLDVRAFMAALGAVVARHDALRLRTLRDSAGELRQHALDADQESPRVSLQQVACTSLEPFVQHVQACLVEQLQTPFDLFEEPPARFFLFRLNADRHAFCAVFSRFAMDGRSQMLFARELWDLYVRFRTGETPPSDPPAPGFLPAARRMTARYEKRAVDRSSHYWRSRLAPDPTFAHLGALLAYGAGVTASHVRDVQLREPARARLLDGAAAARGTQFEALFAQTASIIADVLDLDRLVVLTLADFRTVDDRDVLGPFVRSVPIVLDREPDQSPAISLAQVQRAMLRARVHGYVPSNVLTECYQRLEQEHGLPIPRLFSYSHLDQTSVPPAPRRVAELVVDRGPGVPEDLLTAPSMDVVATVQESQTHIRLVHNAGVFSPELTDRIVDGLVRTLGVDVVHPVAGR